MYLNSFFPAVIIRLISRSGQISADQFLKVQVIFKWKNREICDVVVVHVDVQKTS